MKKDKFSIFLFSFLFILSVGSIQVLGCTCVRGIKPCQRFTYSDLIFVGKAASSIQKDNLEHTTFEIKENISGEKLQQAVIQNQSGSSCDVSFTAGETYLIFAAKNESGYVTHLCSGNQPLNEAGETLAALRSLPGPGAGGKIFGQFTEMLRAEQKDYLPMAGIKLTVREIAGKRKNYAAVTDKNGNYELTVPPGKYKIIPALPPYADAGFDDDDPVSIKDRGCYEKDFGIENASYLGGRILDAAGKPVKEIRVELLAENEEPTLLGGRAEGFSDERGYFEIYNLPAGRYTLSVNVTTPPSEEHPFPAAFYPNTSEQTKAKVFQIGLGQQINNIIFRLPKRITRQRVAGTLVFPDGRPASGMTVNLQRDDSDTSFSHAVTDKNGNFVLTGFPGEKYNFGIDYYGPDKEKSKFTIKKSVFTLEKNAPAFRFILETADGKTH